MAVTPKPIKCGAALADGRRCNELATIIGTQYVYDRQPATGGGADYNLKEIRYSAVCPKCGDRKVIETR
jgi:hypothetical protein